MYPRSGFGPYSRPQEPKPSGLGTLCALATLGLIYVAFTAKPAGPLEYFAGLLVGAAAGFCNAGACAFTSSGMGRVMRRPMRYGSGWLFLMLVGDGGVFWGFHRLAPSNRMGWWWIGGGMAALLLGMFFLVVTSTANASSRRSIDTLY